VIDESGKIDNLELLVSAGQVLVAGTKPVVNDVERVHLVGVRLV
jgi:hypothetical protein